MGRSVLKPAFNRYAYVLFDKSNSVMGSVSNLRRIVERIYFISIMQFSSNVNGMRDESFTADSFLLCSRFVKNYIISTI
jgi:hypothetical protein